MTVRELNRDQLDVLRWSLYYDTDFLLAMQNVDINIMNVSDISDDMVKAQFDGIDFVEDDFFCGKEED
jgi:hypothetical protein